MSGTRRGIITRGCILLAVAGCLFATVMARPAGAATAIRMLVFTAPNCPHCAAATTFLDALEERVPELTIERYDVWRDRAALDRLSELSERLGSGMVSTPGIVLGGRIWVGFDKGVAAQIEAAVKACRQQDCRDPLIPPAESAAPPPSTLELPLWGEVDPDRISLPLLSLVLGLLDSVNPCAFFVLLFLLSLMVHARSRRIMLLVGGTFVLVSGLAYFLFMTAWLNLFLLLGDLPLVTTAAGALAILVALFNIKDFFLFRRGPSLSLSEQAKPKLFARVRGLLETSRVPAVLAGTVLLAVVANSYELLCTAGLPMVFTRILTLEELPGWQYYGYLGLYNLFYVLPLLAIVGFFAVTLGSRKLSEWHGRVLKLLSGMLMLALGLILLLAPSVLQRPGPAAAAVAAAVAVTALLTWAWPRLGSGGSKR